MQLFALDPDRQPVSARQASKQKDYLCLECQAVVRCRSGPHRQAHFYHLRPSATCKLSGKSMAHLQIQCRLWKLLPSGECFLEHRFPSIGRIADVAWLPQRLIFEIQCSSISAEEIAARNLDYASLGFQVVWILHDLQFNQKRISAAEKALENCIHYFTDIDADDRGKVYDQFDVKKRGIRLQKSAPLHVDLSQPRKASVDPFRPWPLHFAGDLQDQPAEYLKQIKALQKRPSFRLYEWIVRPYDRLIQMLLERSCR